MGSVGQSYISVIIPHLAKCLGCVHVQFDDNSSGDLVSQENGNCTIILIVTERKLLAMSYVRMFEKEFKKEWLNYVRD